jgi:hypothetical protein
VGGWYSAYRKNSVSPRHEAVGVEHARRHDMRKTLKQKCSHIAVKRRTKDPDQIHSHITGTRTYSLQIRAFLLNRNRRAPRVTQAKRVAVVIHI